MKWPHIVSIMFCWQLLLACAEDNSCNSLSALLNSSQKLPLMSELLFTAMFAALPSAALRFAALCCAVQHWTRCCRNVLYRCHIHIHTTAQLTHTHTQQHKHTHNCTYTHTTAQLTHIRNCTYTYTQLHIHIHTTAHTHTHSCTALTSPAPQAQLPAKMFHCMQVFSRKNLPHNTLACSHAPNRCPPPLPAFGAPHISRARQWRLEASR
jgi:hypothetical protein